MNEKTISEKKLAIAMLKLAAQGYDAFSNMAPYPIIIDGTCWPTSEHYYQAMKFSDPTLREKIRSVANPFVAAAMGNDRRQVICPDWDAVRVEIMLRAMRAKFEQHADIRAMLLATGERRLVDHTAPDDFWGEGSDGLGRNMVGVLLMRIRDELREFAR